MRKFLKYLSRAVLLTSVLVLVLLLLTGFLLLLYPLEILHIVCGILGVILILMGCGILLSLIFTLADKRRDDR